MKKLTKPSSLMLLFLLGCFPYAAKSESITRFGVTVDYDYNPDGTIYVRSAENKSGSKVKLWIDLEYVTFKQNEKKEINKTATETVSVDAGKGEGETILTRLKKLPKEPDPTVPGTEKKAEPAVTPPPIVEKMESQAEPAVKVAEAKRGLPSDNLASNVKVSDRIHQDPYFGQEAVDAYVRKCESYLNALLSSENKIQFIFDNDLVEFVEKSEAEIDRYRKDLPAIAQDLISSSDIANLHVNLVVDILRSRLSSRSIACDHLKSAVENVRSAESYAAGFDKTNVVNYGITGLLILVLLLVAAIMTIRKNKKKSQPRAHSKPARMESRTDILAASVSDDDPNAAIVVRRRTTSILKKQCLDDVIDNPSYYVINVPEFTRDSAVRKIYVKNTCIKEVYKMYAEDLRNSENPKEDGCMVLGRWLYDEVSQTYDVSMEIVVYPGDDAIFKEYELNFGGKIKLRVTEKLRKLRRDTNLQYDLVCWIHSHPGLGVFFSNSDENVQMQLKHVQHPKFLIAFVVDILTEGQDLGIFTFRKDGVMNSKGDLSKLFSLEGMYRWALESDKITFSPDTYYNILGKAKIKVPNCMGIELSNSAIIDLTQLVVESGDGLIGWAIGTPIDTDEGKEYMISSFVMASENPTTGILGPILNVSPFSMPTIQRLLTNEKVNAAFVLVYSSKQMSLTSIPIINGEVITDELFYGNETIDDLKIWTRRRR